MNPTIKSKTPYTLVSIYGYYRYLFVIPLPSLKVSYVVSLFEEKKFKVNIYKYRKLFSD